jgi:hypothetical protein
MNLLNPSGLLALSALIPIIALYFLKLKRERRVVPSTLLWKKALDDMQVNAPFQRLKYSLLLLLQLLLVALLAFALARPYLNATGAAGRKTIVLVDTSASMATRDASGGQKTRLQAAIDDASVKAGDMREGDAMMLLAFDRDVRRLTDLTADKALLKQLLSELEPRDMETHAEEAFAVALSLSEQTPNSEVLVLSDGCFGSVKVVEDTAPAGNIEDTGVLSPQQQLNRRLRNFKFVSYGKEQSDNVAITRIDARSRAIRSRDDSGRRIDEMETQVFVLVENFSPRDANVVLTLTLDGEKLLTKTLSLKGRISRNPGLDDASADGRSENTSRSNEVFKLPPGCKGLVQARIEAPADALAVDNSASVVVGGIEGAQVLVVSAPSTNSRLNFFLDQALSAMRGLTITALTPEEFSSQWELKGAQMLENFDVCIFDEFSPKAWTGGGAFFIGALPPLPDFKKEEGALDFPGITYWDLAHPIMRYVSFGNVTVAKSQIWSVPKQARVIVQGKRRDAQTPRIDPLITVLENDRMRVVASAFDGFASDWALHSWPLFLYNTIPWLAEASPRRRPASQQTGSPLVIPPNMGADKVVVKRPDGGADETVALSKDRATFVRATDKAGVYHIIGLPGEPGGRPCAVNLASHAESDNAAQNFVQVGGSKLESSRAAVEGQREIWRSLAAVAAALLLLEWIVFHRRFGM